MKLKLGLALLLVLGLFSFSSLKAAIMYAEGGTLSGTPGDYGKTAISFQLNSAITVTDLSFFGISIGGGDTPYVQLWNDTTDTLLGSVSWTAGEAGNGWNTKALSGSLNLTTGITYQVQASAYFINEYASLSGFTFGSEINTSSLQFYGGGGFFAGGGWTPPASPTTSTISNFTSGVNFTYTAVPEPSTYALMALGLGSLWAFRRKKIKA